jgi:hypothetical protein
MAVKQRKGKKSKQENNVLAKNGGDDDKRTKKARVRTKSATKISGSKALLFVGAVLGIAGLILYHYYKLYGPSILLGPGWKDYNVEAYHWRKYLDSHDKTILLIGGPHRSGTTVVWKSIRAHPEAVGFGDRFETGADYSEGILFQDVYPSFGVGLEFNKNMMGNGIHKAKGDDSVQMGSGGGLGQYALLPENFVHLTKENHRGMLDKSTSFSKLMNRFTPYWDTNAKYDREDGLKKAKVWIEKSPQNIVLSSFLEGLYNMPVEEDGSVSTQSDPKKKVITKFLFMTRHPVANVLATDIFIQEAMGGKKDFEVMLRNYIQMHKYALEDNKTVQSPLMWVKLEDFTKNPRDELKKILAFLELSNDDDVIDLIMKEVGNVQKDPNAKYIAQWCGGKEEIHADLITKYNEEIKALGLGYDMSNLCVN